MATTINAGRVRFVSRGTYNNSTQYYLFDLVDYNGSSYIAKENTLGNLPTNTQYWQLIAEKGNTGSTGQTGPVGPTGNGIASIRKTGTSGLVDTYTITYTNGNTTTFTVTNGEDADTTDISKIKEEQTTQNGNISKNADEITNLKNENAYLQNVIKQAFTEVTASGENITIDNTIEAKMNVSLYGNTKQDGEPTPDTPVEIKSVTENNKVVVSNQNLFDKDNANILSGYIDGATKTYQELFTAKSCYISIKPNTTYTISKISSQRFGLATFNTEIINGTTATIIGSPKSTDTSYTITTGGNDKYLVVYYFLTTADTLSEETIRNSIQIEQGSTATSYVPHKEQVYELDLGNIEMNGIGEYRDTFVSIGDKWYKREVIGSATLDGSENWQKSGKTGITRYFQSITPQNIKYTAGVTNGLLLVCSNYFFGITQRASDNKGIGIAPYNQAGCLLNLSVDTSFDTVEKIKTFIADKKPIYKYVKEKSTDIEITDTTLITQLDEISQALSQKGTTIISQNNDDLPFSLDVIALTK